MRVVIDAKVLVSWIITGSGVMQIQQDAWKAGRFTLLVSAELLTELGAVLSRPHLERYYLTPDAPRRFLEELQAQSVQVSLSLPYPSFSDPKDEYLLALLRDGKADVLITGDKALVSLEQFENAKILTSRAFVEYLQEHAE